jgi:hypothetical protein
MGLVDVDTAARLLLVVVGHCRSSEPEIINTVAKLK